MNIKIPKILGIFLYYIFLLIFLKQDKLTHFFLNRFLLSFANHIINDNK